MATNLKGTNELRARLRAIQTSFKPIGREWADTTAGVAKPMVPVRTGRLRASIRRKNASMKLASVAAHFTAFFVDAGPKAHTIVPKKANRLAFQVEGRTVFARKVSHPGYRPRPFRERAATEGLRRTPMAQQMIKLWNSARSVR